MRRSTSPPSPIDVLFAELIEESVALFHRLKAAAAALYGEGEASAGRRGVLRSLRKFGPQTVPSLARQRPVSRQHIQVVVNGLAGDGLVELANNPAHRRSPWIKLTAAGKRRLLEIDRTDARFIAGVAGQFSGDALRRATHTLRTVRRALEDQSKLSPHETTPHTHSAPPRDIGVRERKRRVP